MVSRGTFNEEQQNILSHSLSTDVLIILNQSSFAQFFSRFDINAVLLAFTKKIHFLVYYRLFV